jgi:hypothetical protein
MTENKLTAFQISRRFNVKQTTVRLWCRKGLFPNAKCERIIYGVVAWLVPESDLQNFTPPKMGRPTKPKPQVFIPAATFVLDERTQLAALYKQKYGVEPLPATLDTLFNNPLLRQFYGVKLASDK